MPVALEPWVLLFIRKTRGEIRPLMVTKAAIITDNTACIPQEQAAF